MPLQLENGALVRWEVRHIGVIGPGIVGMPMAALLAHARIREGTPEPARVTVVQRASPTSGWKVEAIREGRSPIGGVEPDLDAIVSECVRAGLLTATHEMAALRDADAILVCVQTDRAGIAPDYGPLFEALDRLLPVLRDRPRDRIPLVVFESTLAPSTMATRIRERFAAAGLQDARDCLLANSPNRVMPGRLVERVRTSDKLVAGLTPLAAELTRRLYSWIVTTADLHVTNSLTAEVVKTFENAYRDVRIAYATEVMRFCDEHDGSFDELRDRVNTLLGRGDAASVDPTAVPVGDLLVPGVGVGGHCLPKDGYLLWWRRLEAGAAPETSLILAARRINDESPAWLVRRAERTFGDLSGFSATLLGVAYRADSEDTRNSPSLVLAQLLRERGVRVTLHDPHVRPGDVNLVRTNLADRFERDLGAAVRTADLLFACQAHRAYLAARARILDCAPRLRGVVDACRLFRADDRLGRRLVWVRIGAGSREPTDAFVRFVADGFRALEVGVAREVREVVDFLNARYAASAFERVDFAQVRRLAATCTTGCRIADPDAPLNPPAPWEGFLPGLVRLAADRYSDAPGA